MLKWNRMALAFMVLVVASAEAAWGQGLFGGAEGGGPPAPDAEMALRIVCWGNLTGTLPKRGPSWEEDFRRRAWNSATGKEALKELGLSDAAARDALKVVHEGEMIGLVLTLPSDTPAARKAGTRFVERLTTEVSAAVLEEWLAEHNQTPLMRAEDQLARAKKDAMVARERVSEARRKVREAAQLLDASPEAVRAAASRLDQERQKLTLELAGQNARQRALEERVAKLSDLAAARADKDPIAVELEKIVKLREAEVSRQATLQKAGGMNEQGRDAAESQVAEARARLLERREAAARAAGTELLGELNKELITLSITIVESEARLELVSKRLEGLGRAVDMVDELEQLQASAARAGQMLDWAEMEVQNASKQLATSPVFSGTAQWGKMGVEPVAEDGK